MPSLLIQIERCLKHTQVPPTRFGRMAVNDPRLVGDLRRGREPRDHTRARVEATIARLMETAQ